MIGTGNDWSRPRALASKDHLYRAHARYEHCFILLEGILIRERRLENGQRQIVGLHVPGDICGLAALLDGRVDHDTIALSPVSCIPVARRWISSIAADSEELSQALWWEMSRELAISAAWIVNLGQRPAYERLAYFLCELEARIRAAGHNTDAGFVFPGTQSDISAITGLSVVHVNRTLNRLRMENLRSGGHRLKFHDALRLRDIAAFDPAYLALDRKPLGKMLLARISDADASRRDEMDQSSRHRGPVH